MKLMLLISMLIVAISAHSLEHFFPMSNEELLELSRIPDLIRIGQPLFPKYGDDIQPPKSPLPPCPCGSNTVCVNKQCLPRPKPNRLFEPSQDVALRRHAQDSQDERPPLHPCPCGSNTVCVLGECVPRRRPNKLFEPSQDVSVRKYAQNLQDERPPLHPCPCGSNTVCVNKECLPRPKPNRLFEPNQDVSVRKNAQNLQNLLTRVPIYHPRTCKCGPNFVCIGGRCVEQSRPNNLFEPNQDIGYQNGGIFYNRYY